MNFINREPPHPEINELRVSTIGLFVTVMFSWQEREATVSVGTDFGPPTAAQAHFITQVAKPAWWLRWMPIRVEETPSRTYLHCILRPEHARRLRV